MKKAALVLALVLLICTVFASVAYAVGDHAPMVGRKLAGYGPIGYQGERPGKIVMQTMFTIGNEDCTYAININRISLVKGDGTLAYEGPLYRNGNTAGVPISILQPHQVEPIVLADWIAEGLISPARFYTLEVSWKANNKCLPLVGHVVVFQREFFDDGTYTLAKTRVPMDSVTQRP